MRALATLPTASRVPKILLYRLLNRSDYRRWTNPANLETWWDSRTQQMASLVPPGTRVLEFGAGRRQLERFLPPTCSYVPSDLADRGPGTVICDLNHRPLPDLRIVRADVAFFAGVLEYIRDLPSLIEWLFSEVSYCVASYAYATSPPRTPRRLIESIRRARYGYMNTYNEEQLETLFSTRGFGCVRKDTWDSQRLFLFQAGSRASAK